MPDYTALCRIIHIYVGFKDYAGLHSFMPDNKDYAGLNSFIPDYKDYTGFYSIMPNCKII